jgi:hypothetical protein
MIPEKNPIESIDMGKQDHLEFTAIKPETGISLREARGQWDDAMSEKGENSAEVSNQNDSKAGDNLEKIQQPFENVSSKDNPRYLITRNHGQENDVHPMTGVPFVKKILEMPNGEWIEGVFPEFSSDFDAKLPEDMYLESDKTQFQECNRQLYEAIEADPKLKEKFTAEQIEQIKDGIDEGTAPDGYVWNHDAEAGKMQLVNSDIHAKTGHTGGRFLWGGGSENR